ncbi:MAG TPA: DUF4129 domain-containing protein [Gammaproteobacteria bacterium]
MNPPLTYTPAYLGLYLALLLAVTSNAFLDIRYGMFGTEVAIWAVAFAFTLWTGWRQQGHITPGGKRLQKWLVVLAVLVSLFIILPVWRLPRGGVYVLAALQVAYNCVLTTRRQLHFGLLVSAVMVMFAAAHFRADWTLLFYLVPYVIAVVFTLVAEQINRRVETVNAHSLGRPLVGGQGAAIAAASAVILALAGLLYAITPQIAWSHLGWDYGVPAAAGAGGADDKALTGADAGGTGESDDAGLTVAAMREAAGRPGMPGWQSGILHGLADITEATGRLLVPVRDVLKEIREAVKEWVRQHKAQLLQGLAALVLLALLVALWKLLREAKPGIWLHTRIDYLRFIVLGWHAPGRAGMSQFYAAMQRLFAWQDLPRHPRFNAREYLVQLCQVRSDLRLQLTEATRLFETARYGGPAPDNAQLSRMRALYLHLFKNTY